MTLCRKHKFVLYDRMTTLRRKHKFVSLEWMTTYSWNKKIVSLEWRNQNGTFRHSNLQIIT